MAEEDKKPETEETSKEIIKDIEKSGVPENIAGKEEKLDEKIMNDIEKKATGKKEEKPVEKAWKEFIIPLRRKFKKTARYKRTPKAIRAIKEFLVRHMKVYERDLDKVKLDKYLNEFVWTRGIRNPPSKVKIKAIIDGDVIRAELSELSEKLKFKKSKLERRENKVASVAKKEPEQKLEEKTEEEKSEEETRRRGAMLEKEKKAAVVEAGQKIEKAAAKQAKHQAKVSKQPKHQRRMALQK